MSDEYFSPSLFFSPQARFDQLDRWVAEVHRQVAAVKDAVGAVSEAQQELQQRVGEVQAELRSFIVEETRAHQLQQALTEEIILRRQLDEKFGRYDELRGAALDLVHWSSLEPLRQGMVRTLAEEMTATASGYWLPPALLAVSAWMSGDREAAERATAEASRRDDGKSSLFFALVCQRTGRIEPGAGWALRYLRRQRPAAPDRPVGALLGLVAEGAFGDAAAAECSHIAERWLGELVQEAGGFDAQRQAWVEALERLAPPTTDAEYPTLRHSPSAGRIFASLAAARRNRAIHDRFAALLAARAVPAEPSEGTVDALLTSLVASYADEEMTLRREARLLELIKKEGGDRAAARRRFAAESDARSGTSDFASLLRKAAMEPRASGATPATQRYAVVLSRQWILAAQGELAARDRAAVPSEIELVAGSWTGRSFDGAERAELLTALRKHNEGRLLEAEDAAAGLGSVPWVVLLAGVSFGLLLMTEGGAAIVLGSIIALIAVGIFLSARKKRDSRRASAREAVEKDSKQAVSFLKAALDELAAFRRELAEGDRLGLDVAELVAAQGAPRFVA